MVPTYVPLCSSMSLPNQVIGVAKLQAVMHYSSGQYGIEKLLGSFIHNVSHVQKHYIIYTHTVSTCKHQKEAKHCVKDGSCRSKKRRQPDGLFQTISTPMCLQAKQTRSPVSVAFKQVRQILVSKSKISEFRNYTRNYF